MLAAKHRLIILLRDSEMLEEFSGSKIYRLEYGGSSWKSRVLPSPSWSATGGRGGHWHTHVRYYPLLYDFFSNQPWPVTNIISRPCRRHYALIQPRFHDLPWCNGATLKGDSITRHLVALTYLPRSYTWYWNGRRVGSSPRCYRYNKVHNRFLCVWHRV